MSNNSNNIYSKPLLFTLMSLVAILIGSIVTAFYPLAREEMHPKLENVQPYTALQLAGRDIYQREGCATCHTQVIRPLKTDVMRYGEYTKPGESYYERPFLWGTRRTGPDLARVGGKYNDEWHKQHFDDPKKFQPHSNMPKYTRFKNNKIDAKEVQAHMDGLGFPYDYPREILELQTLTELDAIIAYMQTLGIAVESVPLIVYTDEQYAEHGRNMEGKPGAVARGKQLFITECAGCHGSDGEGNDEIGGLPLNEYGEDINDLDDYIFITIANGVAGQMPGFINTMTKEQIGSLLEFLHTLNEE